MELSTEDLKFLEESLQRDAVGMLQAGCGMEHPTVRQNRELFGRVWDALYT